MRVGNTLVLLSLVVGAGPVAACAGTARDVSSNRPAEGRAVVRLAEETVIYRHTDAYRVRMTGGERVHLLARGNGALNLIVRNGSGDVVAADVEEDRLAVIRFTPRYTGVFTVQVVNRAEQDVEYRLTAE